jgi:hypothetical protein
VKHYSTIGLVEARTEMKSRMGLSFRTLSLSCSVFLNLVSNFLVNVLHNFPIPFKFFPAYSY